MKHLQQILLLFLVVCSITGFSQTNSKTTPFQDPKRPIFDAASLIGKIAEALHIFGWIVNSDIIEGISIPFILIIIAISSKRIHKIIANTTE